MYKGLFCVWYEIEDRSDELLFLSDSYQDAEKFYHKKINELKNNHLLEFGFTDNKDYLGDFVKCTTFLDNDLLSYNVRFSNEMWYSNDLLFNGDGTSEKMTDDELLETLKSYHID